MLTPKERFDSKTRAGENGCVLWIGGDNGLGYGRFWFNGRTVYAHRWAYEHAFGAIPDGLHLDHLCRTPSCVNPDHLEPVTQRQNNYRALVGPAGKGVEVMYDYCVNGHQFTLENTSVIRGKRRCRACDRERAAKRLSENRNAVNARRRERYAEARADS